MRIIGAHLRHIIYLSEAPKRGPLPATHAETLTSPNDPDLNFSWPSRGGRFYNLYSSADLSVPLANWNLEEGNIAATTDDVISSNIIPLTDTDDLSADWEQLGPIALPVGQEVRIEWCLTGSDEC